MMAPNPSGRPAAAARTAAPPAAAAVAAFAVPV
jgi:hypothetical protein